ncbi:MAG: hypothetical protein ACRBBR_16545 [Cellvibrionaceae bacterium]
MNYSDIEIELKHRLENSSQVERFSTDFHINGSSLLELLCKEGGGHNDFMGCFVRGFDKQNNEAEKILKCKSKPKTESGRVLLYICPECGDIGCGAYGAFVEKEGAVYVWKDFAYENGYEDPAPIENVGPFHFNAESYETSINQAKNI